MKNKFLQQDYQARLDNCICRYKGKPVRLRVMERGRFLCSRLTQRRMGPGDEFEIEGEDEFLDVSTIPLGYCQVSPDTVYYVTRRPLRRWKQGVDDEGVLWRTLGDQPVRASLFTENVEAMILGVYPSLEEVIQKFQKDGVSQQAAISRDVALRYDGNMQLIYVYYRGDEVGWMQVTSKIVNIPSSDKGWIISQYLQNFSWEVR